MKQIISPNKQKLIVVAASAAIGFLGFEASSSALGIFQIPTFIALAFVAYIFLICLQTFIFDLHLKPTASIAKLERSFVAAVKHRFAYLKELRHWLHFQNYLILPGIIYWSTICLLYLNSFNPVIKQVIILFSIAALGVSFWYLKTVFYKHSETSGLVKEIIFLTKFYATYMAFAAAFGVMRYFDFSGNNIYWFTLAVFVVTFLLMHQAFFQHHEAGFAAVRFLLLVGALMAAIGYFVYLFWNVNFYSGALVLSAIYNTAWGLVQHKYFDKNLSREIIYEYLAVLFLVFVIILGSTNFAERI